MGGKFMDGRTDSLVRRGHLCCHCLLVETSDSLVLVDTGFGLRDVADPTSRLSRFFLAMVKPAFREEMTAVRQIERLGFRPSDVRHIVLTHLDFDHAGGLDDFSHAQVHMLQQERDYAVLQKSWLDRQRYRPQQWSTRNHWRVYPTGSGGGWFGFDCVRDLKGLPSEILMVPLPGHTFGHAGVAVESDGKWFLMVGDAYFYHREMDFTNPSCTPGLRFYQWMMEKDRGARLRNQERLRDLRRTNSATVSICCAHDVEEFETLSGRSARIPAEMLRGK
jgi:glyoxylase-like metal-dependent hydrolase (beta-lactamase superfamily II)